MILYLVRHAIAEEGIAGMADKDRELTGEGIAKMKKAAAGLNALEAIPELILSSPYVRAVQTAEILREAFGGKPAVKCIDALVPYGSRSELYREVRACGKTRAVMLVGHQPSLGEIAAEIICGSHARPYELKKGGACAIAIDRFEPAPAGTLLWFIPPVILRRLG
jgi:phosphohistidine phosphatase